MVWTVKLQQIDQSLSVVQMAHLPTVVMDSVLSVVLFDAMIDATSDVRCWTSMLVNLLAMMYIQW